VAEYLIKWAGYSENSNSWEVEKNILDKTLIQQFEATHKKENEVKVLRSNKVKHPVCACASFCSNIFFLDKHLCTYFLERCCELSGISD
jgi:hypothetical protein